MRHEPIVFDRITQRLPTLKFAMKCNALHTKLKKFDVKLKLLETIETGVRFHPNRVPQFYHLVADDFLAQWSWMTDISKNR